MTIPPLESETQARTLPQVRAAYDDMAYGGNRGLPGEHNRAILDAAIDAAGIGMGEYDWRVFEWLSRWEPQTVAAIAGWVERAFEAGKASGGSDERSGDG